MFVSVNEKSARASTAVSGCDRGVTVLRVRDGVGRWRAMAGMSNVMSGVRATSVSMPVSTSFTSASGDFGRGLCSASSITLLGEGVFERAEGGRRTVGFCSSDDPTIEPALGST